VAENMVVLHQLRVAAENIEVSAVDVTANPSVEAIIKRVAKELLQQRLFLLDF
jgi:hypothetical protein